MGERKSLFYDGKHSRLLKFSSEPRGPRYFLNADLERESSARGSYISRRRISRIDINGRCDRRAGRLAPRREESIHPATTLRECQTNHFRAPTISCTLRRERGE